MPSMTITTSAQDAAKLADAVGWAMGLNGAATSAQVKEYTIALDRAQTAGGTVIDEQGQSVAGVTIRVQGPGNRSGANENVSFQTTSATSDAEGRWQFPHIPKNFQEIRFILTRDDYAVTLPTAAGTRPARVGASGTGTVGVVLAWVTFGGRAPGAGVGVVVPRHKAVSSQASARRL